ncbi:MAG: aspartate carbamoyltransferase catalytic subunit [Alphaproteobacteria bacterium]
MIEGDPAADFPAETVGRDWLHKDLLGIQGLKAGEIAHFLEVADSYVDFGRQSIKSSDLLAGKTVMNLFFENSTRTRASFEIAAARLGADVVNMDVATSSVKKGESLLDTAYTLEAMRPDFIVVRHSQAGAPLLLARKVGSSILNAGDGQHEHPTQALLDALTLARHFGRLNGLTVAICGDVAHSRVARSNLHLLTTMGAHVRFVGPPSLAPKAFEALGADVFHDMAAGISGANAIMMLRVQKERMGRNLIPSDREFFDFFGLTENRLKLAAQNALVLHPGPMNRGVEIASEMADLEGVAKIREQVEMGVAVRMAAFELMNSARSNPDVMKVIP